MSIVANKLPTLHPQMLKADLEQGTQKQSEDLRAVIGRAIERAIAQADLTKQEVAYQLGYTDAGVISRWCSGSETPQFAKLFALPELRQPIVIQLARLAGAEIGLRIEFDRCA